MAIRQLQLTITAVLFVLAAGECAHAGGMSVRPDTIEFNAGPKRLYKPNAPVVVSFDVYDYEYGSNEYKYLYFAVVPAREKLTKVNAAQISKWKLLYMRAKEPVHGSATSATDEEGLQRIEMKFDAPAAPGQYRVLYNKIAAFKHSAINPNEPLGQVIEPLGTDRPPAQAAALQYANSYAIVATFTVSNAVPVEDTLTVYLRANGENPAWAQIKSGVVDKPLEMSWYVGPEFKLDKSKVLFRYKIFPIDEDWSAWTTEDHVKYHFLPRGTLNFRVEAMYKDGNRSFTSQSAKFNFVLPNHLVAKATAETLTKGTIDKAFLSDGKIIETKIAFDTVYARSRALIVGVAQFDDKLSFREFPADKIQRDVDTLEVALTRNGFEVSKLFKSRVTRDEIVAAVDKLVEDSQENDRLFIYFSSHGFADRNMASDGYIATSDCQMNSPSVKCFRLADIEHQARRALEGKRVRQVLIAADSCFSGLGVISKAAGVPDFSKLAAAPGAYMLTAGMADQLAEIDPNLKMSTFTHYLAKGLSGEANMFDKNGIITLTELFLYVQYNVAKQSESRQIPMLGRLRGNGEMLFRPKAVKVDGPSTDR